MNLTLLILLIVAGVVLVAGFVVGLVFFIFFLVKSLTGATGGWRRLAEFYGTASPPEDCSGQVVQGPDGRGLGRSCVWHDGLLIGEADVLDGLVQQFGKTELDAGAADSVARR